MGVGAENGNFVNLASQAGNTQAVPERLYGVSAEYCNDGLGMSLKIAISKAAKLAKETYWVGFGMAVLDVLVGSCTYNILSPTLRAVYFAYVYNHATNSGLNFSQTLNRIGPNMINLIVLGLMSGVVMGFVNSILVMTVILIPLVFVIYFLLQYQQIDTTLREANYVNSAKQSIGIIRLNGICRHIMVALFVFLVHVSVLIIGLAIMLLLLGIIVLVMVLLPGDAGAGAAAFSVGTAGLYMTAFATTILTYTLIIVMMPFTSCLYFVLYSQAAAAGRTPQIVEVFPSERLNASYPVYPPTQVNAVSVGTGAGPSGPAVAVAVPVSQEAVAAPLYSGPDSGHSV